MSDVKNFNISKKSIDKSTLKYSYRFKGESLTTWVEKLFELYLKLYENNFETVKDNNQYLSIIDNFLSAINPPDNVMRFNYKLDFKYTSDKLAFIKGECNNIALSIKKDDILTISTLSFRNFYSKFYEIFENHLLDVNTYLKFNKDLNILELINIFKKHTKFKHQTLITGEKYYG